MTDELKTALEELRLAVYYVLADCNPHGEDIPYGVRVALDAVFAAADMPSASDLVRAEDLV